MGVPFDPLLILNTHLEPIVCHPSLSFRSSHVLLSIYFKLQMYCLLICFIFFVYFVREMIFIKQHITSDRHSFLLFIPNSIFIALCKESCRDDSVQRIRYGMCMCVCVRERERYSRDTRSGDTKNRIRKLMY